MSGGAQARSALYGFLAELLSFPTEELASAIQRGQVAFVLNGLAGDLPFPLDAPDGLTDEALTYLDLQSEYMRLFDLPGGGPACPLYAGVFAPSRRDAMEELVRFYRHFGVTVSASSHDLPDSIPTVLEFMHYLAAHEAQRPGADSSAPLQAAQRDVLERHLLRWTAMAAQRLPERGASPFYQSVVDLLHRFCEADLTRLGVAVSTHA